MKELLYLEIPTPETDIVRNWLQQEFQPNWGQRHLTPDGILLSSASNTNSDLPMQDSLSIFIWSLQRTTYLKVFRWAEKALSGENQVLETLTRQIRQRFPHHYPEPPDIDLSKKSIFDALAPYYPLTVKYFQKMPKGEYDLTRAYWWERRWREGVRHPQEPKQVIFRQEKLPDNVPETPEYDLIYIGGALGVIHATVMARLGYKVALLERLGFGRMNREWNISRDEFQSLIDLDLFTPSEFESVIAREYKDGFHKFFDANNPPQCKAAVLQTPTVLNIALDTEKLLQLCGEKFRKAGGEIWDETEFQRADIYDSQTIVQARHLPSGEQYQFRGRLLVDAMGTASPIAWQLNGGRAFDSVCPTVGASIESGLGHEVWDRNYGDVLHSHGDISRGRQLIWELFPGRDEEVTIYLFHYHQMHPDNPGSLLEMYEDFFTILPEYRRCDMDELVWRKATFGYIPGHFSVGSRDRQVAFDRLTAIGDAASLQSPLIFTGFGSLIRNLQRLTTLLDSALQHDLLQAKYLNQIRAYQSNVAVTWLFSKGMMVPTRKHLPPERINSMLNTFFGILAEEPAEISDRFIKDRTKWFTFTRLALKAARQNPTLLVWIWQLAGPKDMFRWLGSYLEFTINAMVSWLLGWLPAFASWAQPWLEPRYPALWFRLLAFSYFLTSGMGRQPKVSLSNHKGMSVVASQ